MDKGDPDSYDEEPLPEDEIRDIEESLSEIQRGEIYPLEDVIRELRQRKR
jgi:hypothetical protein